MLKMKDKLLIFVFALILQSCASTYYHHDVYNPCNSGSPFQDTVECDSWKTNRPKEYQRYLQRMKKYEENGKIEKFKKYYDKINSTEKEDKKDSN